MRHLIALLTLAFALVACDESTTAPVDTIPGPPNAPRLKVTVLTGAKEAPVDSPTVKVEWAYTDSVGVALGNNELSSIVWYSHANAGIGSRNVNVGCGGLDSSNISVMVISNSGAPASDTVQVYCKQSAK